MAPKLLVLDNYDSFTFNLVHLLRELGCGDLEVHRNDKIAIEQIERFDRIVLSPGPGIPSEAGLMPEIVRRYAPAKPILGICLGHQCIGEVFGGRLRNIGVPVHGKATPIELLNPNDPLFQGLPKQMTVGRYHSWVVDPGDFPAELEITAVDEAGEIMALRHRSFPTAGLQFHPESVLTPDGRRMLRNWLDEK